MVRDLKDFLLDETTFDLKIVNGDFVIDDSAAQHKKCLLLAAKGDYKNTPLVGVDIFRQLNDHNNNIARDIRIEFIKDGMNVRKITQLKNDYKVDANY
jgi:hypothetical protein